MSDDAPSRRELPFDQCLLYTTAEELVDEVVAYDLPPDFEPGDWPYNMMLASIRHEYTNYEELLARLPNTFPLDDMPFCPCPREPGDCFNEMMAHDMLKWRAKDAAEGAYSDWVQVNREKK